MNNRTPDSHYPWTKKWGAGQKASMPVIIPASFPLESTMGPPESPMFTVTIISTTRAENMPFTQGYSVVVNLPDVPRGKAE